MWNEVQDNRHTIRVNKGDPQPPQKVMDAKTKRNGAQPFPLLV